MEEQKLLKKKRKALADGNKVNLAAVTIDLAEFYFKKCEYEDAIKEYKAVAELYKEANKVLDYGTANRMIGEAYTHLRQYNKALSYQQIYFEVAKKQNNKLEQQRALATIGHTYLTSYLDSAENQADKDALNLAYKSFMRSLMVCESLTGISKREHMDMSARLFANLGVVQECRGNFDKGIELLKKSINVCKTHDIYEQLERGYTSLATLYIKKESYREAIHNLNLALDVASRLDDKANLMCSTYLTKADILVKLDDFQGAKTVLLKAHKLKTPNKIERDQIETNLKVVAAICYTQDSLLTTPDTDYKKIKTLYEKLGDGCCMLKNFIKAIEYYEKMLEAVLKFSSDKKDLSPCYTSLAQTYLDCDNYDKAIEYFKKDFEICKGNPKESISSLLSLINAMELAKKPNLEIENAYKQAEKESSKDKQLLGKVLTNFLTFLKKNDKYLEATRVEGILLSLDYAPSDTESEADDSNTPNIGDDICIDEITDESGGSDVETDLNKPRMARKRMKGCVVKRNNKGETQLHTACISGNMTLVQRLVDQGHPINIRDHCGWLPIHEACICGHVPIVELLINKGAHINDRGGTLCNGMTPLHDACSNGHLEVIQLLLDRNASAVAKTDDGETPLSILKNWRANTQLSSEENALYESIVERMSYALEKSGNRLENHSNKENVALVMEKEETSFSRRTQRTPKDNKKFSPKEKSPRGELPKKSPLKSQKSSTSNNRDLRRIIDLSDEESDSDAISMSRNLERRRKRISSDSQSSGSESEQENAGSDYRKVIASFRNRNFEHVPKKHKSNSKEKLPAIVLEDEFVDDDWLEDDLGSNSKKPKKRRTNSVERMQVDSPINVKTPVKDNLFDDVNSLLNDEIVFEDIRPNKQIVKAPTRKRQMSLIKAGFTRRKSSSSPNSFGQISPSSSQPRSKQARQQTKLTDFSHVRNLAEADSTSTITSSSSFHSTSRNSFSRKNSGGSNLFSSTQVMETMLSIDVRIDGKLYRVPVPLSEASTKTIEWLAEEAAKRYSKKETIKPTLELESENGAVLADDDTVNILFNMGSTQAEVHAKIIKWNIPPLIDRYKENCTTMNIALMEKITKAVQESTTCLNLSNVVTRNKLAPLCKAINRQNNLQQLILSGCLIGNETMQVLSQSLQTLINLSELNLSNNHITSTGLKYFADIFTTNSSTSTILPHLTILNLSYNPLDNECLTDLSLITVYLKLTRLELADVGFDKEVFEENRNVELNLQHIEYLDISYNEMDKDQVMKFVNWIKSVDKLNHLDISSNKITEEGLVTELVAKLEDVDKLQLHHLNLSRCLLTDAEMYELLRCIMKADYIETFDASYNHKITAISLRRLLQHSSKFRSINLTGCTDILKYFEDCTDSLWNILQEDGRKLENLKLSIDYSEHKKACDILIDMWKKEHQDKHSVFNELENFLELSICDT